MLLNKNYKYCWGWKKQDLKRKEKHMLHVVPERAVFPLSSCQISKRPPARAIIHSWSNPNSAGDGQRGFQAIGKKGNEMMSEIIYLSIFLSLLRGKGLVRSCIQTAFVTSPCLEMAAVQSAAGQTLLLLHRWLHWENCSQNHRTLLLLFQGSPRRANFAQTIQPLFYTRCWCKLGLNLRPLD